MITDDNTFDLNSDNVYDIIVDKELANQVKFVNNNIILFHNEFFSTYRDKILEFVKINREISKKDEALNGSLKDRFSSEDIEKRFNSINFDDLSLFASAYCTDNCEASTIYVVNISQDDYFLLLPLDILKIYGKFMENKFKENNINRVSIIDFDDEYFRVLLVFK